MGETETAVCKVVVDRERLSASLAFRQEAAHTTITRDDLARALLDAKIEFTPGLEKRLDKLAAIIEAGKLPSTPVLVAKGQPPDPGENGRLELTPELQALADGEAKDDDEQVNFYEQHKIISVSEGQVIGKVYPPRPPKPGKDVLGQTIKPKAKRAEITLGSNVRYKEDGVTVVATCDGRLSNGTFDVAVLDVLEVGGDVDFESGNIDSASDVLVRGNVLDLFSVKSKKSIEVNGSIEAADVRADGDLLVRGGICGKEKGKVVCGGELRAKFCDAAHIDCEGDLHVAREVLNCQVRTNGAIFIRTGSLIGGKAHARNGGELKVLGSAAGVKTLVGIGMDPEIFTNIKSLDERVKSLNDTAQQIRTAVKPLLDSLRRLTPEQREKATELMFQADDLDAQAENIQADRAKLMEQASPVEGASLLVSGNICEGVIMTVDNFRLRFDKEFKGPVRIEKRKVENVTEVAAINQLTGSIQVLPARKIELNDSPNQPDSGS